MTPAERTSMVVSLAALLVSAGTAYFQFFWENQDFRVQWLLSDDFPRLDYEPNPPPEEGGHITTKINPTAILINQGNQNIVVTDIGFTLLYSLNANPKNIWSHGTNPPLHHCNDLKKAIGSLGQWERIKIGEKDEPAHPLVIEPGKTIPVRIHMRQINEMTDKSWRPSSEVTTCFYFRLIDKDGVAHERTIPALTYSASGGRGNEQSAAIQLLD